jgi:hypothetical protein
MVMEHSEWEKKWNQLVVKAWMDEDFKKRLLANPAAVLKQEGLEVPPGVQVKVVQGTDTQLTLLLPASPSEELSEEELKAAAGAGPYTWCHWCKKQKM